MRQERSCALGGDCAGQDVAHGCAGELCSWLADFEPVLDFDLGELCCLDFDLDLTFNLELGELRAWRNELDLVLDSPGV